jgi:hypothetical protein
MSPSGKPEERANSQDLMNQLAAQWKELLGLADHYVSSGSPEMDKRKDLLRTSTARLKVLL